MLFRAFTLVASAALLAACGGPSLKPAPPLLAPYGQAQVWGVAPLRNESGTSLPDGLLIADAMQQEIELVDGLAAAPVNRVVGAMRGLGLTRIASPAEASAIMSELHLDALLVGSITAYDPYRPMTLGLAFDLYVRGAGEGSGLDPEHLTRATSLPAAPGDLGRPGPASQASAVFAASDHHVVQWLEAFAAGRHEPGSALGTNVYMVSMDAYTKFACHRLLGTLLHLEQQRVGAAQVAASH